MPELPDVPPEPSGPPPVGRYPRWQLLGSLALGLAYGLGFRLAFGLENVDAPFAYTIGEVLEVMSVAFIFGAPVAIGFVTVYTAPGRPGWGAALGLPLVTVLLTLAAALLLAWEGLICIVVWVPLAALLGMAGGLVGMAARRLTGRPRPLVLAAAALLPVALGAAESRVEVGPRTHVVEDAVVIHASAANVWAEIRSVPAIAPAELGGSFAHAIGFPRPVAAELEGTGVGSVRHASFEGGIVFREVVTEWAPGRALAFTIDPSAVPPETFDQHVAVGGPYFDVLDGRYVIEPVSPASDGSPRVRLRLASTHRLSTTFNGYTRLWTDRFMRDIQQAILDVIRDRAERRAKPPSAR